MPKLMEIFDVWYGVNLEFVNCEEVAGGIPFVSRTANNNGVVGYVKEIDGVEPNPGHTLSVAAGGSVLSTFYHPYKYYSGRDIYILKPKSKMTAAQLIYYCAAIEKNKYKYNYGRQANKTLKDIVLPDIKDISQKIEKIKKKSFGVWGNVLKNTFEG